MNKFKRFLKNTFSFVGTLFSTHPVTFVAICVGTLLGVADMLVLTDAISMNSAASDRAETILLQFIFTAVIFALFAFYIESSPAKQKMPLFVSIPVYLIGFVLAFVLSSLTFAGEDVLFADTFRFYRNLLGTTRVILILYGVCTILLLLGITFCYRRLEDATFSAYCAHLFSGFFFAWIIFGFLAGGTASLTGIFTLLLWGDFEKIYFPILTLLFGGFYVMRIVSCFTEKPKDVNAFIYVLVRYVLLIMCMIAYVIIYAYMIKILVLREFPSNSVYEILTALFVVSMPIAYMAAGMVRRRAVNAEVVPAAPSEPATTEASATEVPAEGAGTKPRDVLGTVARFLPVVFIPFIGLQIYTTAVRIGQYGLTIKRYFGALFILFEIVAIVLYILSLRKKAFRFSVILPVLAGFVCLSSLIPFANAQGMSHLVQLSCLNTYLRQEGDSIDKNIKSRAGAAYEALNGEDETGKKYLEAHFSKDEREKLADLIAKSGTADVSDRYEWSSWQQRENETEMDIAKYAKIRYAYIAAQGKSETGRYPDLSEAMLYLNTDHKLPEYVSIEDIIGKDADQTVDISAYADQFAALSKQRPGELSESRFHAAMQEIQTIPIGDHACFYVKEAQIRYHRDTGKVMEILLEGYYLSE